MSLTPEEIAKGYTEEQIKSALLLFNTQKEADWLSFLLPLQNKRVNQSASINNFRLKIFTKE